MTFQFVQGRDQGSPILDQFQCGGVGVQFATAAQGQAKQLGDRRSGVQQRRERRSRRGPTASRLLPRQGG